MAATVNHNRLLITNIVLSPCLIHLFCIACLSTLAWLSRNCQTWDPVPFHTSMALRKDVVRDNPHPWLLHLSSFPQIVFFFWLLVQKALVTSNTQYSLEVRPETSGSNPFTSRSALSSQFALRLLACFAGYSAHALKSTFIHSSWGPFAICFIQRTQMFSLVYHGTTQPIQCPQPFMAVKAVRWPKKCLGHGADCHGWCWTEERTVLPSDVLYNQGQSGWL